MSYKYHRWVILVYVIVPFLAVFVGAVAAWNHYMFWSDIALLIVLQFLCTLGITIGYHRMLTHDSFKVAWPIRAFFVICGCLALEGQPISWVATHVKHHAHSDDDDDPHSPMNSFWHAHMGWLFSEANFADPAVYAPHLLKDRLVLLIDKLYLVWALLAFVIPFAIGGWTGLLWGGFIRVFLTTHVTWSVNSVFHTFGKRNFETTDESRNNWLIGLLAMGEGWHNNHHAFPKSAFHGFWWYQFDLSGIIIRSLERLGMAWDVQRVSDAVMEAHQTKGVTVYESIALLKEDLGRSIDQGRVELQEMMLKLPAQKVALVRFAYESTMRQFADIQIGLAKRRMMKKAAIERRRLKVMKLMAIAKQQLQMAAMS